MTTMFSETVENSLFKIEYGVEVFVKHQSKLEFGMGNSVTFPVVVRGQGYEVPFLQERIRNWQAEEGVPAWNPSYVAPTVYCGQTQDASGNYRGVCSHDPNDISGGAEVFTVDDPEELARQKAQRDAAAALKADNARKFQEAAESLEEENRRQLVQEREARIAAQRAEEREEKKRQAAAAKEEE
mmetsp:Transcript_13142/g.17819  ORF Transcript_13142/g.17819 Transcript_13142/m.17819 type:complete len:184 (-) Transcript_13142:447-998(-)